MKSHSAALLLSILSCLPALAIDYVETPRKRLTQHATFYYGSSGTNAPGCGDMATPCRDHAYILQMLWAEFDLAGKKVTVKALDDGPYTVALPGLGKLVGQVSPHHLVFSGHSPSTLYQPAPGSGYPFLAAYGAEFTIENAIVDYSSAKAEPYLGSADLIGLGFGATIHIGQGVTLGCNFAGFNAVTAAWRSNVIFDADFAIDVGRCQTLKSGVSYAAGTNVLTMASTADVSPGTMGIFSVQGKMPQDAYFASKTATTVTFNCLYSQPCATTAASSDDTLVFVGGGQALLNLGAGSTCYFNTNGNPDYSIAVTLANYPFYQYSFYINELSACNAQGLTFRNAWQAFGGCAVTTNLSHTDTAQGVPYLPCNQGAGSRVVAGVQLTEGSRTFTVPSPVSPTFAGIKVGNSVNGIANVSGTFTAGSPTISVASVAGLCLNARVNGEGILGGAVVTGIDAGNGTFTVGGCSTAPSKGPRCVNDYPTYESKTGATLAVSGCGVSNGTIVTSIAGNEIEVSKPATFTGAQSLIFQGEVSNGAIYN